MYSRLVKKTAHRPPYGWNLAYAYSIEGRIYLEVNSPHSDIVGVFTRYIPTFYASRPPTPLLSFSLVWSVMISAGRCVNMWVSGYNAWALYRGHGLKV